MIIFYNDSTHQWGAEEAGIQFGKSTLVKSELLLSNIRFVVNKHVNKVGPLIGILTSKEQHPQFYGNRAYFKKIQSRVTKNGGISFVMTPEGLKEDHVDGYVYVEEKWHQALFPLPDIIYNRVASYHGEQSPLFQQVKKIATDKKIPFYNPHFFEKWQTYQLLKDSQFLRHYLPKTELLYSPNQLKKWLSHYSSVFVKRVLSSRGRGIYCISNLNNSYLIQTNQSIKQFSTCDELWIELCQQISGQKAVIQPTISLRKHHGRPYDYRILVQRKKSDWQISGIGIRQAGLNAITTHVPQGGQILSHDLVDGNIDEQVLKDICENLASQLEKSYGYLCEFSIDLGIDVEDNYWIFEVNSKPMKFDEPEIQQKALDTLIQCFYADADFE